VCGELLICVKNQQFATNTCISSHCTRRSPTNLTPGSFAQAQDSKQPVPAAKAGSPSSATLQHGNLVAAVRLLPTAARCGFGVRRGDRDPFIARHSRARSLSLDVRNHQRIVRIKFWWGTPWFSSHLSASPIEFNSGAWPQYHSAPKSGEEKCFAHEIRRPAWLHGCDSPPRDTILLTKLRGSFCPAPDCDRQQGDDKREE